MKDKSEGAPFEKEILEAWEAIEPPEGFADRVIKAKNKEFIKRQKRSSDRKWVIAASLILAIGCTIWIVVASHTKDQNKITREPHSENIDHASVFYGEIQEPEIYTEIDTEIALSLIKLGEHGTATVNNGNGLNWAENGQGVISVEQNDGDVFYLLNGEQTVELNSPSGLMSLKGSSFRVTIKEKAVSDNAGHLTLIEGPGMTVYNEMGYAELDRGSYIVIEEGSPPRTVFEEKQKVFEEYMPTALE